MRLRDDKENTGGARAKQRSDQGSEIEIDREIARRVASGDRAALREWLDGYMGYIYSYLLRRIGPGGETIASEVTGATFEAASRSLKRYARGAVTAPMRLWLLRLAGAQLAKRGKHIPATEGSSDQSWQMRKMQDALRKLKPQEQSALSLALLEGLTGEDLAQALGTRLPRAMHILRRALHNVGRTLQAQEWNSGEPG